MSASKRDRERELARAKHERQQERRAAAAARRRRRNQVVGAVAGLAVVAAFVVWFAATSGGGADVAATPSGTPQSPVPTSTAASPLPTPTGKVTCTTPPAVRTTDLSWKTPPVRKIDTRVAHTLTLVTNCGTVTVATLPAKAPATVNSMAFLAGKGFFDKTRCHRLTTDGLYVVQCGDPKGTGAGGPGYTVPDENLPAADADGNAVYKAGTVAMANTGEADSGGSQFFLVYADTTLPAKYTVWGTVTDGLDVLRHVAQQGVEGGATDGAPAQPLVVTKATMAPAFPG